MSTLAANSAASPSLSLMALESANAWQTARESGEDSLLFLGGQRRSNESAIAPDFCSQSTDENLAPLRVPGGEGAPAVCLVTAPGPFRLRRHCAVRFGYAALRVMVPP